MIIWQQKKNDFFHTWGENAKRFGFHAAKMLWIFFHQAKSCEFFSLKMLRSNLSSGQLWKQGDKKKGLKKLKEKKVGLKNCWRKVGVKFSTVLVTRECKRDCHMFVWFFVIFVFIFIIILGFGFGFGFGFSFKRF